MPTSTARGASGTGVPIDSTNGPWLIATMCSTFGGGLPSVETASSTNSSSLSKRSARLWDALEADRRGRLVVDAGAAAGRAAEVAGPDLDVVGEGEQPLVQGAVDAGGALALLDRQVGAGHVPDEERVARQHRPGVAPALRVAEEEGGVLRAVARGVHRLDLDVSEGQPPAVGEGLVRVLGVGQLVDVDASLPSPGRGGRARRRGRRDCGSRGRARSGRRAGGSAGGRARSTTAGRSPLRRPRSCRRPGTRRSSRSSCRICRKSILGQRSWPICPRRARRPAGAAR